MNKINKNRVFFLVLKNVTNLLNRILRRTSHLSFYLLNLFILISILLISCQKTNEDKTENVTKLKVYCDESIYKVMEKAFLIYDSLDTQTKLEVIKSSAFDAMKNLLSGNADAIVIGREYTDYEDSLVKAFNIKHISKSVLAKDALVFYTDFHSVLDTIAEWQLVDILTNKSSNLKNFFPQLKKEPEFVTNSNLSSELANLYTLTCKGKKIQRKLKTFGSSDSVINYLTQNPENIGIGYLSQIIGNQSFKALRISFNDTTGKRIYPRVVHQANMIQNLYPYNININIYVFDKAKDEPMRLARILSKSGVIQRYFNDFGIVPAYAQVNVIDER